MPITPDDLTFSDELLGRSLRDIAMQEIERRAADLQKADRSLTTESAIAKAATDAPWLYDMSAAPGSDQPLAAFLVQKADDARDRQIEEIILKCSEACQGDVEAGLEIVRRVFPSIYAAWVDGYRERR